MTILRSFLKGFYFQPYTNRKLLHIKKIPSDYISKRNKSSDDSFGGSSSKKRISSEVCEICGFVHKTTSKSTSDNKPLPKMLQHKSPECAPAVEESVSEQICKPTEPEINKDCVEEVESTKTSKLGIVLIIAALGVLGTIGYKAYERKTKD